MIDLGIAQKPGPSLVLSIAYLNHERAVVSYVPRTTTLRGTCFEISHQARGFDAQDIGSIPVMKLVRRLGSVEPVVVLQGETAAKL